MESLLLAKASAMRAKKAKSTNIEKNSRGRWMKQIRWFTGSNLNGTDHRGAPPMPFVATRFASAWPVSRREEGEPAYPSANGTRLALQSRVSSRTSGRAFD